MKLIGKLGILPIIGLAGFFICDIAWDRQVEKRLDALEQPKGIVINGMEYEMFPFYTNNFALTNHPND